MLKQINFRFIFLLIVISILLGVFYNFLSPFGVKFIRENIELQYAEPNIDNDLDSLNSTANYNITPPSLIMTEAAYTLYNSKKILFIDARDQWDFDESHIKGSINIPEYKFDMNMPIVKALNKNFTFIVYCGDVECDVSKRLAVNLSEIGFNKIYILEGGVENWIANNYPMEP
ncbi:MAG: rhodanese-like domain-containing protein [Ignavibacteriae bacterium]|nr:rhodanese-like domain-containing protein [Ignavibacteriota bacterium]NOG96540.1 rhodanese-like domain-containing protein [Ignavibacteriota bacterium]